MIQTLASADPAGFAASDGIVDVRSPAEFAEDHVPGAVNLPVLDDAERARVGTIYVQELRMKARRLGAALVARNIARHLEEGLKDKPGSWAPLIYCWRGGQRSNAMATVLEQVGWRPTVLSGGYKTYRRRVTAALYDAEPDFRVILLDGYTGVAKTEVLGRLERLGVQTLDLEGLAAHRGSLFGALPGHPQPHQKGFELALLARVDALDRTRPVVVEAKFQQGRRAERAADALEGDAGRAAHRAGRAQGSTGAIHDLRLCRRHRRPGCPGRDAGQTAGASRQGTRGRLAVDGGGRGVRGTGGGADRTPL